MTNAEECPSQRPYPPSTRERIDRLRNSERLIFEQVLNAMQDAEEMWGSVGQGYLDLMQAIIDEASCRQQTYAERLAEEADEA